MNVVKFCLLPVIALFTIALLGGYFWANSLPADWEVIREETTSATPAQIHPLVADLQRWEDWGIWYEREPDMLIDYSGAAGVGQVSEWTGAEGSGKHEILSSDVAVGVTTRVSFEGVSAFESELTYTPQADGKTLIRWRSHGTAQSVPEKIFGSMSDDLLGPDFEQNLTRLAAKAEANVIEADGK